MQFWILLANGQTVYRRGDWESFVDAKNAILASVGSLNIVRVHAADPTENRRVDVTNLFLRTRVSI